MKPLLWILLFAFPPASIRADTLTGTVADAQGGAIPNALVVIHWDSVGLDGVRDNVGAKENLTATTDATGHFSFELPAGVYEVFVSAAGFAPHCKKITVKTNENLRFEARLRVTRMLNSSVN